MTTDRQTAASEVLTTLASSYITTCLSARLSAHYTPPSPPSPALSCPAMQTATSEVLTYRTFTILESVTSQVGAGPAPALGRPAGASAGG